MTSLRDDEVGREFLRLYRRLPTLWKTTSEDYKNRNKRKRSLNILLEKYKQIEPSANIQTLKTKICNVRTCYRREVKKIEESIKRGEKGDKLYTPTLWYYPLMDFLRSQEIENAGTELDEDYENSELQNIPDETLLQWAKQTKNTTKLESQDLQRGAANKRKQHNDSPMMERKTTQKKSRKICIDNDDDDVDIYTKTEKKARKPYEIDNDDDDVNIYTKYWGCGFRKLSPDQQIYAKKAFEDILLLGQLNRLSFDTVSLLKQQISSHTLTVEEDIDEVAFEKYSASEQDSYGDHNSLLQNRRESSSPLCYSHEEPFQRSYNEKIRKRISTKRLLRGNPLEN